MTQRPPMPPQPLDAEERALARALPRLHGRTEPGPDLDARILAAARESLQPSRAARPARRPRIRWIAPASLAASLLLAFGLAWRLRPLPSPVPVPQATMEADAAGANDAQAVRMIAAPAESRSVPMPMVVAPPAEPAKPAVAPAARPEPVQASPSAPARQADMGNVVAESQAMPAPPPAPPAAKVMTREQVDEDAQAAARAGSTASAKSANAAMLDAVSPEPARATAGRARVAEGARQSRVEAAPQPPMPVIVDEPNEAERAADAGYVDDPDDNIPPATVDSPSVRDAWLQRIRQLLDQGNVADARASLAEFRRRYPDAALPSALQELEDER